MALSAQELEQIATAARQISSDAAVERLEDFVGRVLNLNAVQLADYFPKPDPTGQLAIALAEVTGSREAILRDECSIPSYVAFSDALEVPQVAGFHTFLQSRNCDERFLGRLRHHEEIRTALRRLERGHHLELLAAAIMNEHCKYGEATRGSGDQGIDAIGWRELFMIESAFSEGAVGSVEALPGEKVFLFASSKALMKWTKSHRPPKLINPAHIRELVGGWLIQRSSTGIWQKVGIRMLSPVQMILVTTYRLSANARAECRTLGIQVWGIPELIYLICRDAPPKVFDALNAYAFSPSEFRAWWKLREQTRMMAA
jgi:hypothetical protein